MYATVHTIASRVTTPATAIEYYKTKLEGASIFAAVVLSISCNI
jgi:hypothetical protein